MVYWLEFFPFTFFGPLLFWTGIGLLPMAPMVSCLATGKLWTRASHGFDWRARIKLAWLGIAAGIAMLVIVEVPTILAAVGLTLAANGNSQQRERGTTILKYLADTPELGRFGAGESTTRFRWALDLAQEWLGMAIPVPQDVAREVFRATGRPLDQVHKTRRGLDDLRAGDQVGAQLPKLRLGTSTLEVVAEPDGGYSYTQWTMEFFNGYESQQEARAEVALPPGGVVSRLTLWVNGEEREAAFAGKSEVRAAYTAIVAKRRDPVLVTMTAPGRVLVQCFPVPTHGTMKIRLGITAPLLPETPANARYVYPHFTHENFGIDGDNKVEMHASGIENLPGFHTANDEEGRRLESDIKFEPGIAPSILLPLQRGPGKHWVHDTRSGKYITQNIRNAAESAGKAVVVIDRSSSLAPFVNDISAALSQLPDARVILATTREPKEISLKLLEQEKFWGGADNTLALQRAVRTAREDGRGTIVWIHGPQPILLTSIDEVNRELKQSPDVVLWSLQLAPGRNAVLENLNLTTRVQEPLITSGRVTMLASTMRKLSGAESTWSASYETSDTLPTDASPTEGSLHLARLWAAYRVRELAAAGNTLDSVQLAAKYQLVTPVSGAVVLETVQQFQDAGLTAVDKATVPTVPEPSTWALLILGAIALCATKRKAQRSKAP